jgi:membrane dipeptidase
MRIGSLCCAASALLVVSTAAADDEARLVERARLVHERVLTLDTHVDIPFEFASDSVDPGLRGRYQVDLPKMRDGGLDAAFWIVYVGQTQRTAAAYDTAKARARIKFDAIHRMADVLYPEQVEIAYRAADVERIHRAGKIVAVIGIENGFVIGTDLSLLPLYHKLGARYITLAHGGHNDIADSATPRENLGDATAEHDGVSPFGGRVIASMNRLGIMVDVSHISKDAVLDAVRLSRAPVIASHSNARALADHPRNLDDETLRALADRGGVLQTVALGAYVKAGASAGTPATVADFVDHIDYAVERVGLDHVGISSDFDGGGGIEGWRDASQTLNVTVELVRRGYTEAQIGQLWSGNLLRVWRQVEQVAARMQSQGH